MGQWKEVAGKQETHRKTHCWESESSAFPFMEYPHDSEFFFLMILSIFLTIKLVCLKSFFFFFFLVIRSFTYNNQSLETTQISITS